MHENTQTDDRLCVLFVRPAWAQSNGCKSRVRVDSAKHIAKGKGVHREVESKGNWRRTSGLTNRNHLRHCRRVRLQNKLKPKTIRKPTV